ncbi:GNAT family N-acetyltransferase [Fulvivirga sp. M361]|uniref:GNAT family N-acetyltransferase n=1 Tax=Fulvivirga sp. M361 TaxID=2594266 RepID=UPI00117A7431|nr:GNAT family N-acetyltransferase [Fulvivirga sp. M361]TRX59484.1 GNAT family N-acetyltransferase [Fulvivirga sp. M361]
MDKFTLREAILDDLPHIVNMLASDKLGVQRESFTDPLPEAYVQAFDQITADPAQYLMVMELQSELVGTLQLSFLPYLTYQGGVRAQIEAVRVHNDHRGKGLGRKMIMRAIEMAQKKGAHMVQLTTDKKRPEAIRFYNDLGFTATHEGMKLHF